MSLNVTSSAAGFHTGGVVSSVGSLPDTRSRPGSGRETRWFNSASAAGAADGLLELTTRPRTDDSIEIAACTWRRAGGPIANAARKVAVLCSP